MTDRTRSTGPLQSNATECKLDWHWEQWTKSPLSLDTSQTETVDSGGYPTEYEESEMNDVITPGFHTKMCRGVIINNAMDRTIDRVEAKPPLVDCYTCHETVTKMHTQRYQGLIHPYKELGLQYPTGTVYPNSQLLPSVSDFTDNEVNGLKAQAISQARARVGDAPINVWVTIGEARETLDTLIWAMRTALKLLSPKRAIIREYRERSRSGKWITFADLGAARDLWLQIRYGIRPIINDIQGALKALSMIGQEHRLRFSSDEYQLSNKSEGTPVDYIFGPYFDGLTAQCIGTVEKTVTVNAGCLVQPRFEELGITELIGTGEIIAGAWDLVPYSFVIDWFVNVGDVISSWAPNVGYAHPLASWVTVRKTTFSRTEVKPGSLRPSDTILGGTASANVSESSCLILEGGYVNRWETTKIREPNPSVPVTVHFNHTIDLGAARILDLIALVSQFIKLKN